MLRRFFISLGFLFALSAPAWAINCAVANGTCFWIGGTGTLDLATDSAHWSSTTNGSTCSCEPIASNILTFDACTGCSGSTVTVAIGGGTLTAGGITMSAFTGTLDFAANDNNVALSGAFSNSGSGARTINMGDGTWTITAAAVGNPWNQAGATNLTFNANSSTLVFALTQSTLSTISLGPSGTTYNIITLNSNSNYGVTVINGTTASTIGTLNLNGPNLNIFAANVTYTITTLNLNGGSSLTTLLEIASNTYGTVATLSIGNAITPTWCTFRDITKTGAGSITATNSIDLGHNTGFASITAPTTGGSSGGGIIGG